MLTASERADAWSNIASLETSTIRDAILFAYASPDGTPGGLIPTDERKKITNHKSTRKDMLRRLARLVVDVNHIYAAAQGRTPWIAPTPGQPNRKEHQAP